jgi:putative oxidoreductase
MNWIDSVVPWTATKHNIWFAVLRMLLGIFIIYKGVTFTYNSHELFNSLNFLFDEFAFSSNESNTQNISNILKFSGSINFILSTLSIIYLLTAHLIGGILLVLGLYTRWICLIQLPILLVAVFIINLPKSNLSITNNIELGLSIITLIGLANYFVLGAGHYSIDHHRHRDLQMEDVLILKTRIR